MEHQTVRVVSDNCESLANCTRARAEFMVSRGKAEVFAVAPFTIRLLRSPGDGASPTPSTGLSGNQKKKRKRKVARLHERDGSNCFYCGKVMPPDDMTLEHLLAKADGGSDHPSNLVLAHAACNQMAADMPVIGKVLLRDHLQRKSRE
ncbi:HNH endonuclease [Paraburkholderia sp. SIMBA_054]|uniref:HNH endonuclease n=1 Tax=Paraburkholderia sp. SIMBA_054 TaxID=3085795 RepID=UPI003978D0CB